ncbi:CdaR family protein [Ruminiclostridium josui]|uniref:CdaR family protein n=1 Tax=Ruminiclostridium josui TaxID=1499 RepID=UPI00046421AD|nr:CdaR family protein [Ruminiclostridium josui]
MKEFLKKDLTLKIFSIIFAIFLWFAINPVQTEHYTVPLNVINEESLKSQGLVLNSRNFNKYVVVDVRDKGDVLDNIKDTDFEVTLDLSKVKSVNDKVIALEPPVYLGRERINPKNIELKPKTITLDLARIEENPFIVQIETTGKLSAGYEIISKTAQPTTVSIQDIDTVVASVGSVKAFVDVTGLDRNLEIRKECKVYDKKGVEMRGLGKKLSVDIKIEVGKRVPVIPITQGTPADNYLEGEYSVKPNSILVTGDTDIMEKVNEVKTVPINIEKADKTLNTQVLLQIPDGLKLVSSSREVSVEVKIIPLDIRTYKFEPRDITLEGTVNDNTLAYEIVEPVSVVLKGKMEDMSNVTLNRLFAKVDVSGLKEGEHRIPLQVKLPANITQSGEAKVHVKITKVTAEENQNVQQDTR